MSTSQLQLQLNSYIIKFKSLEQNCLFLTKLRIKNHKKTQTIPSTVQLFREQSLTKYNICI